MRLIDPILASMRTTVALFVLLASLAFMPPQALSQQAPEPVEAAVMRLLEHETVGLPGEVEISVGQLDPANRLPPCAALEPFLPPGARAWGRVNVGVRCDSPVIWTVYLSAQVSIHGEYLVVARPIRPGQAIGPDDVRSVRGDITAQPASTLTDLSQAVGQHARFAVAAGNTLRADMLRTPIAVQQGQNVKVVTSGAGFSVSNEGRAMNRAGDGEQVRVRLSNGQVVTGIARSGGIVEVGF